MKKKFLMIVVALTATLAVSAQNVFKGVVLDETTNEPLIGVTVYNPESKAGTTTNLDGSFSIKLNGEKANLTISYIGYVTQTVTAKANQELLKVNLKPDVIGLNDVVVTSSVAIQRKTPIAVSVIEPQSIEQKLGSQEFPEILKSTPGIYATKQGGGFGDSRVNLRGFESENIAVMINGVPMNDMEWGGVYWSNWAGLSDVTRSMQVQRGLGASKIAAPSVGGSINIVTKSTEAKRGGNVFYGVGNDGYNKMSFALSTGLTENNWAITMLGAKTWGDGYIQGTEFEGYSYFLNISKIINDKHQLSLTGFGAPQWHNQRKDQLLISEWAKYGQKYNAGYGFDANGQRRTFNYNYYHKPQISLNHFWTINEKSSLSTALYTSIGQGGGYGAVGTNRSDYYGSTGGYVNTKYRNDDNTFDFATLMKDNADSEKGSLLALSNSINNHFWYGLLSTYSNSLTSYLDLQAGIDLRFYQGIHQQKVVDLLGGDFVIDPARASGKFKDDPTWVNQKLTAGDITYRDYDGFVAQEGVFGQLEYNQNDLSAFVAGAVNNTTYWRVDRFYYDNERSEVVNKIGFSVKGGANYNINDYHNVFANVGYFSRTPYFSGGVFLQSQTSNAINYDAKNEKVFSAEIGYGFRSKYFSGNINVYRTSWMDKTMVRALDSTNPEAGTVNLSGVNALHKGVEIDFKAKPAKGLEITGMISLGDWRWNSNATGYLYNADGQAIDIKGNVVEIQSPDHAFVTVNLKDIKVGNSAQITANLGVSYEFLKGFRAGIDYTHYAKNYAKFNVAINSWGENKFTQPWEIPQAGIVDLFANYKFNIGAVNATLFGTVNNLFDQDYITDAVDGSSHDASTAAVYYGFGRTWTLGLKFAF